MRDKNFLVSLLFVATAFFFSGCEREDEDFTGIKYTKTGALTMKMHHVFKNMEINFDSNSFFVTAADDTIKITDFKYYLTNVTLISASGSSWNAGNYKFVDARNPGTVEINNIPAGVYTRMSFNIGVDAVRNHTGAQEGDLDPDNAPGMFWGWNSGYIFFRLLGSHYLQQPDSVEKRDFSYDIGGDQHLMKIEMDLSAYKLSQSTVEANIRVDAGEFFETPTIFDLRTEINEIHTPTPPEINILKANILEGMFTLSDLH